AVVWRGTASWLVHYFTMHDPILHTIEVDAGTFNISSTKIDTSGELIRAPKYKPHNYDEPQHTLLTVDVDGQLSFLHVQRRGSQLERWTRQEDAAPIRWLRTQVIELNPPSKSFMLTLLEEKGGMLFVKDDSGNMYTIDLETGAVKKFTNFGTIKRRQLVPLEMDWPAFFMSCLGAHEPHSKKPSS
uniref:F-box associated domain-containing protein n=1 Tax=Aegilops tauschii subsp. strangulata TaxID=200361 RepID=A0A453T537_AEGTS